MLAICIQASQTECQRAKTSAVLQESVSALIMFTASIHSAVFTGVKAEQLL